MGLTLAPQTAAHAEALTTRDPAHDVVRITRQHPAVSDPDPAVALGDLTAFRVRYGPRRIHAIVHFRRLDHSRPFGITFELQYRNARQFLDSEVSIVVRHAHWRGHLTWSGDGDCPVTHEIDYRRDLIAVSFPMTCIDTPRWVAARVQAASRKSAGVFDTDDLPDQHGNVGTYGPRIHQGRASSGAGGSQMRTPCHGPWQRGGEGCLRDTGPRLPLFFGVTNTRLVKPH
jgi:hypothetical protein